MSRKPESIRPPEGVSRAQAASERTFKNRAKGLVKMMIGAGMYLGATKIVTGATAALSLSAILGVGLLTFGGLALVAIGGYHLVTGRNRIIK